MRQEDVHTVMQLDRQCFSAPWSENAYRTELNNPCAEYYVAWSAGRLVGYAGIWLILDEVHITTIGVAADMRGMRVGERLLIRLLDASREREARRVTLEVRKSNSVAINLYKKYGFREAAIRKGYYSDNGEDALIMWVDDLWSPEFTSLFNANKARILAMEAR